MRKTCSIVTALVLSLVVIGAGVTAFAVTNDGLLVLGTWNVRGYPEKTSDRISWFSEELAKIAPDVLCVQEIGNQDDVTSFLNRERGFSLAAFDNSSDKMDNAIFFSHGTQIVDLPDPEGFQHPAQAVYFRYRGLDATLITIHLSWSDTNRRVEERNLLIGVVNEALNIDPDVIVAGDFNTSGKTGDTVYGLAASLGLQVLASDNAGIGTTYAGSLYDFVLISPDLYSEEALGTTHVVVFGDTQIDIARKVSDHRPVIAQFRTDERYADSTAWPPKSLLSFSWNATMLSDPTGSVCLSCLDALNAAPYEDFHTVDGIGDTLARRLVAGQPYASTNALDDVKGIGPAKMQAIIEALCTD